MHQEQAVIDWVPSSIA